MTAYMKKSLTAVRQGFTLIELLIVMAILGVLAVVVLVAINPVQQLARTRDSGRKSTVTQVGHALEAHFTARNGEYLDGTNCIAANGGPLLASWMGCLQVAGEMSSVPSTINNSVGTNGTCTGTIVQNAICYAVNATSTGAVIYTVLESATEESKCPGQVPNFIWSTSDGRGGTLCLAAGGAPDPSTTYTTACAGSCFLED
jgi:prepilin-type N-terminal cleavage/methylation domain-containing protein